VPTVLKERETD